MCLIERVSRTFEVDSMWLRTPWIMNHNKFSDCPSFIWNLRPAVEQLFTEAAFHQSGFLSKHFSLNLVIGGSFIERMNDSIRWSDSGFSSFGSFIKSTLKHAPLSQQQARPSRSVFGLLVQELWLIKVSPTHLAWSQPCLPAWWLQEGRVGFCRRPLALA